VNRARNSAYEVDRKLDDFLRWERQVRGREPLLFVTGDHGEEFREHGRVGHGSEVTEEQVHVPLVVSGPGVPVREVPYVTSSVDIVPTILSLLGDTLPPARYGDGRSLFAGPSDRFVLSSVGWEPKFAIIGRDIKAVFSSYDAGLSSVRITDPWDRPLPDADARFAAEAPQILRAFARKQLASPPDRPGS
ncbi:MAG TPA: sulfatase-like hydrolase/transferase, partial [Opitutaceae bacterium]|nr:sulfatase-like hydrolase/transferase [Opitutaceae bacterium]